MLVRGALRTPLWGGRPQLWSCGVPCGIPIPLLSAGGGGGKGSKGGSYAGRLGRTRGLEGCCQWP